jgi:propane monooxygenase reductase subunit
VTAVYDIRVEPFGHTFDCGADESILTAALRNRLYLRYGCKHGGCGTCKVQLVDGEVEITASNFALPPGERDAGTILVCQSYPVDDCVLDVTAMNLDSDEFHRGDATASYPMTVESVAALTPDIRKVVLRHPPAGSMPFVAGQFVNVVVPGTTSARSFSMANGSADADRVELICKILPGGLFSGYLAESAGPGDRVEVTGPFGALAIRLSHREVVMVAGGSGLAPLLSMLIDLARKRSDRVVTLFFGARTVEDLYALDDITALAADLNLTFVPVVQQPPPDWTGATGLVTDALAAARESWSGTDAYLCGPPAMIDGARDLLVSRGVRPQNVYFDAFVSTGETTSP